MSFTTKGPWDEINLPIINIYIGKRSLQWKKLVEKNASRCVYKFPARYVGGENSHLQNTFPCFLISFGAIVLVVLSHLLSCSFPRSSVLCLLECTPLPVGALLLKLYLPWGSGVIAIEKNLQHEENLSFSVHVSESYWYKQPSDVLKVSLLIIAFPSLLVSWFPLISAILCHC